ncbi:hypothetical protein BVRB_7g178640 [Beta vulgaris subsp. vulgaris]|uniref:Uncharacterized protein n=1 Tax=Beta vulgaris subsp. vulgaris TaxID=3555 RepID=A0A0J8BAV3_BETVV|nr:hypothetical protein BVRB_7g178640 [Beta vulgaris subsp. vulgaris]
MVTMFIFPKVLFNPNRYLMKILCMKFEKLGWLNLL